jgi:tight adherence protein C
MDRRFTRVLVFSLVFSLVVSWMFYRAIRSSHIERGWTLHNLLVISLIIILSLILAVAVSFIGMRLWVRPREAMERVAGGHEALSEHISASLSEAALDFVHKLGAWLPASPRRVSLTRESLVRAGIRDFHATGLLYGLKLFLATVLPTVVAAVMPFSIHPASRFSAVVAAAGVGFFGPNLYVSFRAWRRHREIEKGLTDAIDLLLLCVESGLGLDQSILQVAKELDDVYPALSDEFSLVNLELKAGKRRAEALHNLANRTKIEDLRELVAVIIRADRFGTGIFEALQAHAKRVRQVEFQHFSGVRMMSQPAQLLLPFLLCLLPALVVVTQPRAVAHTLVRLFPSLTELIGK